MDDWKKRFYVKFTFNLKLKSILYQIGGSDVASGTETIAIKQPGDNSMYKLYGYKWFSSATDSDMTITLARILDENNNVTNYKLNLATKLIK